jgi:hypothetical protein
MQRAYAGCGEASRRSPHLAGAVEDCIANHGSPGSPTPSANAPEPCVRRCHIPPATAGCLDFVYGTIMDYYVAFALLGILGKVTFSLPNNWDCLTHVDSNVSK